MKRIVAGRYELGEVLGKGATGQVFAARDIEEGHEVALKILDPSLAGDENFVARFKREVRILQGVASRSVVPILSAGWDGKTFFIAYERLYGETLDKRLRRVARLPMSEARPLVRQLLKALAATHEVGVIHRDVKPANIFLEGGDARKAERLRLLDFGISKWEAGDGHGTLSALTRTGDVLGTCRYMAPEQFENPADVDGRADLFAAGAVAFRILTGAMPYGGGDSLALIMTNVLTLPPRTLQTVTGVSWPTSLEDFFTRAFVHRDERFGSASEMLDAWMDAPTGSDVPEPSSFQPEPLAQYADSASGNDTRSDSTHPA